MAGPADRPRVFLDADVLVAGSASRAGASHLILQLSELGLIDAVSSAQARTEVERTLRRKLPAALPAFALIAQAACRWVDDPPARRLKPHQGEADPKDLPILVAAIERGCLALLTFNKRHFKPAAETIRVEAPGEFLERLRAMLSGLAGED